MRARLLASLVVILIATPSLGDDRTRFVDLERAATEVPADLGSWAAPLLLDCRGRSPSDERRCLSARRRERSDLARRAFYVELGSEGRVQVGSYEPTAGGFRVSVPGLAFAGPEGKGRLSTRPFASGVMPAHRLGEGFVAVPRDRARAYAASHTPAQLVLRMVFRVGDEWVDTARADAPDGYGVGILVLGLQVFHATTGEVLVDTLRGDAVPPPPPRLGARAALWTETWARDVTFEAPDGTVLVLTGRATIEAGSLATREAVLLVADGGEVAELLRFPAPCCSATIDVRALADERVLAILTERASTESTPGRGEIVLLVWDGTERRLVPRARWAGSNLEAPPAWATDPSAPWSEAGP